MAEPTESSTYIKTHMSRVARVSTVNPLPPDVNKTQPETTMPETVNRTMTSDGRQTGGKG